MHFPGIPNRMLRQEPFCSLDSITGLSECWLRETSMWFSTGIQWAGHSLPENLRVPWIRTSQLSLPRALSMQKSKLSCGQTPTAQVLSIDWCKSIKHPSKQGHRIWDSHSENMIDTRIREACRWDDFYALLPPSPEYLGNGARIKKVAEHSPGPDGAGASKDKSKATHDNLSTNLSGHTSWFDFEILVSLSLMCHDKLSGGSCFDLRSRPSFCEGGWHPDQLK